MMPSETGPARANKLPGYFYRLSQHARQVYLKSDSIDRYDFAPSKAAIDAIAALTHTLESGDPIATTRAARIVAVEVCRMAAVPPLDVEVKSARPKNARGELHGLFYPSDPRSGTLPRIVLWMRTAERRDVVKPRTFLRTLMHELAHYFDYSVLDLEESFHTRGFFARESFLMRSLVARSPTAPQKDDTGPSLLREWLDRRSRDADS